MRPTVPPRALRLLLVGATGLGAVAGCSAKSDNVETKILDRLKAKDYPEATRVTCNRKSGLKKGDKLQCDAQIGEAVVPLEVEFVEDRTFSYKNTSNVVRKADLEAELVKQTSQELVDVTVDCGPQQVYVVRDVPKATCTATVDGTTPVPLALTVQDPDQVDYSIRQPYVALALVEKQYAEQATRALGQTVTLDCPGGSIFLGAVGDVVACKASSSTGATITVTLTLLEEPGKFTLKEV